MGRIIGAIEYIGKYMRKMFLFLFEDYRAAVVENKLAEARDKNSSAVLKLAEAELIEEKTKLVRAIRPLQRDEAAESITAEQNLPIRQIFRELCSKSQISSTSRYVAQGNVRKRE